MSEIVIMIGIGSKNRVTSVKEENRFITFIWEVRKNYIVIHGSIELAVLAYFFSK